MPCWMLPCGPAAAKQSQASALQFVGDQVAAMVQSSALESEEQQDTAPAADVHEHGQAQGNLSSRTHLSALDDTYSKCVAVSSSLRLRPTVPNEHLAPYLKRMAQGRAPWYVVTRCQIMQVSV